MRLFRQLRPAFLGPLFPARRRVHSVSVNADEISHFSRLAAEWWDERGEFGLLHKMNPIRMSFIRQKLAETARDDNPEADATNILHGSDVLDVGCGGGLLSESLARLGANTLGVDASSENINIATLHAGTDPKLSSTLSYQSATVESLLSQDKRYDVVCSMEVVEHVDNPTSFLASCAELVKPSGHLFLSTIARTPLSYFLTILMAENVLKTVTPGTHTHSKYINPSELVEFFQKSSKLRQPWISPSASPESPTRTQAEVRGMIYNPLSSNWVLAPRGAIAATQCNYIFWVRKPPA